MTVWSERGSSKKCGTTMAFQMLREDKIEKTGTFKACAFKVIRKEYVFAECNGLCQSMHYGSK